MSSLSAFDRLTSWMDERGLYWLLEFFSLLFGTGLYAMVAILSVFLISRIPNQIAMALVGFFIHSASVYLFVDATVWRTGTPTGVAFPAMVTLLLVGLMLTTWWTWSGKAK